MAVEKPKVANTASARWAITVVLSTSVGGNTKPVLLMVLFVMPSEFAMMLVSGVTPTEDRVGDTSGTTEMRDCPVPNGARRPVRSSK